MLKQLAPAKINLTLEVLGKRPDGFHEIKSIVQTISLYDEIYLESSEDTTASSNLPEWDFRKSLISPALDIFRQMTGIKEGVSIKVVKRIPLVSGLGGDSSNAAALLKGLNKLWDTGLSISQLHEIAQRLGSDVPLFLYGGLTLIEGRGEKVIPLSITLSLPLLLMIPPVSRSPGKTGRLYASLQTNHYTDGSITEKLLNNIKNGKPVTPDMLFNTFENVTFTPQNELDTYRRHILKLGINNIHLAGSGPTLFSLLSGKTDIQELLPQLEATGVQTFLVELTDFKDIDN